MASARRPDLVIEPVEEFVQANGLRHHLVVWDGGGRTTLLLLHGVGDQAWCMLGLVRALPPTYHVVAVDLRGHGDTDWIGPGHYYYAPDFVADLVEVAGQLRRDRLVLVGHSLGGLVVVQTAGTLPDSADAVVAVEAINIPDHPFSLAPSRYEAFVRAQRRRASSAPYVMKDLEEAGRLYKRTCPRIEPTLLAEVVRSAVRPGPEGGWIWKSDPLLKTAPPIPTYLGHLGAFLARIARPTLFVQGAESKLTAPEEIRRRAESTSGALVSTVPEAGHMVHLEAPVALATVITEWLQRHGL